MMPTEQPQKISILREHLPITMGLIESSNLTTRIKKCSPHRPEGSQERDDSQRQKIVRMILHDYG